MDESLKVLIKEALAERKRLFAQFSDVAAIVCQESHGLAYFTGAEPLYQSNLKAACQITGLTADQINKAIVVPSGEYQGKLCKFRCEKSYWKWARTLGFQPAEKFLLSCSIGLGQKMTRYLVSGHPEDSWISMIEDFMGNVPLQLQIVASDIDHLLVGTKGDRPLAFTRYNAGPSATNSNAKYRLYGIPVANMAKQFAAGHDAC